VLVFVALWLRKLMSEEATPFLSFAVDLMRRFMPKADQRTLTMAAIWLVGQCVVFVRNREHWPIHQYLWIWTMLPSRSLQLSSARGRSPD
jgi:hypothetical protein